MKNDSQQFILIPLLQVFNSSVVSSEFPYLCLLFNPLTLSDFQRCRAVSPLNCQTAYKDVANTVSKFGGILCTPI